MTSSRPPYRWQSVAARHLIERLMGQASPGNIVIIGIDGSSRSGKTSLAAALAAARDRVAVIHTDDIAWHHSFFNWTQLLITGLLEPLRRAGPPVSFTPQPWIDRGRHGSIDIPSGTEVVLVEGVGAARLELARWLDATVWVETPAALAMQRTTELDRDPRDSSTIG